MSSKNTYILGIESSCDDTAAAILCNGKVLSNVVANQAIHEKYGGVVPELASRAHQQNIVPVVDQAIKQAGITLEDLSAVAFTQGPGLMGSLLVGTSFAKSLAYGLNIPLIDVNHMQAHILAHFIEKEGSEKPAFPFFDFPPLSPPSSFGVGAAPLLVGNSVTFEKVICHFASPSVVSLSIFKP